MYIYMCIYIDICTYTHMTHSFICDLSYAIFYACIIWDTTSYQNFLISAVLHRVAKMQRMPSVARLVGCLELQISFRKRATNSRALLRKMTYKDKASCVSTPPSMMEWVISRIVCHRWMSRVSHDARIESRDDKSHINDSCLVGMSRVSHGWVMSHTAHA